MSGRWTGGRAGGRTDVWTNGHADMRAGGRTDSTNPTSKDADAPPFVSIAIQFSSIQFVNYFSNGSKNKTPPVIIIKYVEVGCFKIVVSDS